MGFVHLERYRVDESVLDLVPHEVAQPLRVLPLFRDGGRLALGVAQPEDLAAQDYVRRLTGLDIEPVLVEESALENALRELYVAGGTAGRAWGRLAAQSIESHRPETGPALTSTGDSPVARLFEQLVAQAVQLRASDIHLEIAQGKPRLRYRVDGVLHDFPAPPVDVYPALVSRIKILANLDIAEKRRPQDGRISLAVGDSDRELRISIIPYIDGEGVVVRILGAGVGVLALEQAGFCKPMLERYRRVVRRSHGLLLVTGPTGAGKTTTLYGSLAEMCDSRRKIVTLEDPVEYRLDGVCQIPVRPDLEFDFAEGLRALLRHDPDVIMLGEIRDLASAEIAIRASLTGHLILATLHTNTAAQAVTRLIDIGLAPYKVMTSLLWVLAQRLVRRLCEVCRDVAEWPDDHWIAPPQPGALLFVPRGCARCGGLGYWGRVPVYEYLEITPAMRQEHDAHRILELARADGFVSMQERALAQVLEGVTSLAEIEGLSLEL